MPAEKQKIFQLCPRCKGEKEVPDDSWKPSTPQAPISPPLVQCPTCLGEGHIEFGYLLVPGP